MARTVRRPAGRRGSAAVAAILVPLLLLVVAVLLVRSSGSTAPAPVPAGAAADALAALPVRPGAAMDGYQRDAFGESWVDVDGNGCRTRDDVLARDLDDVRRGDDGCVVLSGTLADPYTGTDVAFRRGAATSADVQIDHVVALAAAWRTGAVDWDEQRRTDFANDPLELLAVDGRENAAKGDSDAAEWLPPEGGCDYAARQVAVKTAWELWVTPAERDALAAVLDTCPGQVLPAG